MSGKKAQRTKGNTQASSSSRAAKFLQNDSQSGFLSFSGLASGGASTIGDVNSLDAELRLLVRKMAKKDTITRLKAVQEFTLMCKDKDGEGIKNLLNFWPRMYNKLAHDFDHRVRECTQQAHYQLTTKAGRNLAPFLKQIIVNWLMSQFDIHTCAATNAKNSFDEVFQEKKRKEVLVFSKTEILQACEKNLLRETADTLSDPKTVTIEEREAKYNRFISSTFLVLKYLLENLECNDEDATCVENLNLLFAEKKFWKFAKHDSPMIRTSFYITLLTLCEHFPSLITESLASVGPTILTNFDEQDPVVTKALWDVLLYCLSNFKTIWQFVNLRKAVWPKFWKLLNNGCYGNISIVYPNLLPLINNITPEVAGEGTEFYTEFFNHIGEIVTLKQKVLSDSDLNLVICSYMECIRCLLTKNQSKDLYDFVIWTLIADLLHNIFHRAEEYHGKYQAAFMKELHLLLAFLHKESQKSDGEQSVNYKSLYTDLWTVISVVIFVKSENDIKFKVIESAIDVDSEPKVIESTIDVDSEPKVIESAIDVGSEPKDDSEPKVIESTDSSEPKSCSYFYESLTSFLSFCSESETFKCTVNNATDASPYAVFICDVMKCYIKETFGQQNYAIGEEIIKLASSMSSIDILKLVCTEKSRWENDSVVLNEGSSVDVCKKYVSSILLPLLTENVNYKSAIIDSMVAITSVLKDEEKKEYLVELFERDLFSGITLLELFVEVFKCSSDEHVLLWLKSTFVEEKIMAICTVEIIGNDTWETVQLKWQILRNYVQIIEEHAEKLSLYHNKILVLIKYCIESGDDASTAIHDAVLTTFASLCKPSFEISMLFQETLFAVVRHNVFQAETKSSLDAMHKGVALLMGEQRNGGGANFEDFLDRLLVFLKENCTDADNSSELCTMLGSLLEIGETRDTWWGGETRSSGTYVKLILEKMFDLHQSVDDQAVVVFTSKFLQSVSNKDVKLAQACCVKKLTNTILKCICVGYRFKIDDIKTSIDAFIQSSEFIHFRLVEEAVNRCLVDTFDIDVTKTLLQSLHDNNQLTEVIFDHVLMLSSPANQNYAKLTCDTYCMILSILNDISTVRALVEMYVDELRNNGDISANSLVFGQFIKVVSAIVSRWYHILQSVESADLEDYFDIVHMVFKNIITWKDSHADWLLFSASLAEHDEAIVVLNINLMKLLCHFTNTAVDVLKGELWDCLLCSMISWIQTCEESAQCLHTTPLCAQFMCSAFSLFNKVACLFDSSPAVDEQATKNIIPCIYLKEQTPLATLTLGDDATGEWKEFFLPTASTSLLSMFMKVMLKKESSDPLTDLEQIICSCIRFIPPFTIHEAICGQHEDESEQRKALEDFYSSCCDILSRGNWWSKIACYQLLTGLGESIEGKLCFMSQVEDEEHEGMRSFPLCLTQTMENSRDETLKALSNEGVSIKEPLASFDNEKGKSQLLTYILSWQLMLQLFKMADPSNRALFANYFHNNSDVHDLITCLFCLMPQSVNMENIKKVTITKFSFPEIRQIAFHLLTTAMESIPALIRNWFNNHVNPNDGGTVNRFVSNFISPLLLKNEFKNLNESSKEFNNMVVKTRASAREIAAIYTVDEVSMELVVQLGGNHPLSPVSVTCGKRIGVSNSLWRQWMLQLNTFLSFQNGSILDGLALWKRNVDKRFEGVEECMVCFSVLHGSNYSLPSIACKTCKKKFHPACLYKWFNTSGKCTCPLCRNVF